MAVIIPRDPEAWARLGRTIREHREEAGYSRRALAAKAGVSEKSIQVAEEGRVPRGRMPQSLGRIGEALGWMPGAYISILRNDAWARVQLREVDVQYETEDEAERRAEEAASNERASLAAIRDAELTQAGHVAQDTFIRQMKRFRKLKNISTEQLAKRTSELGQPVDLVELEKLENGTQLLKMAQANALARALGTTVEWLLGSAFANDVPDELTAPPTDDELQVEAKAVEQRMFAAGAQVSAAAQGHQFALERLKIVQQDAEMAAMVLQRATAQQAELSRQYHYLIGRIDSLRAAKGEKQIMEARPVYEPGQED